jgi:hypothetical protein
MDSKKRTFEYKGRMWEVKVGLSNFLTPQAGVPPHETVDIVKFTCLEKDRFGQEKKHWRSHILPGSLNKSSSDQLGQLLEGAFRNKTKW